MTKQDLIVYSSRPTEGGRSLAAALDARYMVGWLPSRKYRPVTNSLVVNWGASTLSPVILQAGTVYVLNTPYAVRQSVDKIKSYKLLAEAGVPTLEYTTDIAIAQQWAEGGTMVLGRENKTSGGKGISITASWQEGRQVEPADFYTKYFPKTHEYRVHVFGGGIIDVTQKRRRIEPDQLNGEPRGIVQRVVRSHDNGWVHCHENVHMENLIRATGPNDVGSACIAACRAIGLDFTALDVLCRFSKENPTELRDFRIAELNTAPGLGNRQTIDAYTQAVLMMYKYMQRSNQQAEAHRELQKYDVVT